MRLPFPTEGTADDGSLSKSFEEVSLCPLDSDDGEPIVAYNGEVCPICLGPPKIGVKTPCGHLLCADCLASYCDVRIAPAPPPCPLCRAPLDSVALACDLVSAARVPLPRAHPLFAILLQHVRRQRMRDAQRDAGLTQPRTYLWHLGRLAYTAKILCQKLQLKLVSCRDHERDVAGYSGHFR